MRIIALVVSLFITLSLHAQESEGKTYFLPDGEIIIMPEVLKSNNISSTLDTQVQMPQLNEGINYPLLYNASKSGKSDHRLSCFLYNYNELVPGIGNQYEAGGFLMYKPFDKLTISIGASATKFSINGGSYNDFLFSADATYRFSNRIALKLYGQYALNSQANSLAGGYLLSPQNCYGAILMIKVVDKRKYSIDMNIGAERSYNPLNHEWEMNYKFGPEIRLK